MKELYNKKRLVLIVNGEIKRNQYDDYTDKLKGLDFNYVLLYNPTI